MSTSEDLADLMSPTTLGGILEVSPKTLANWRCLRIGPVPIRLEGGLVRYRRVDVDAWLEAQAAAGREWMAS